MPTTHRCGEQARQRNPARGNLGARHLLTEFTLGDAKVPRFLGFLDDFGRGSIPAASTFGCLTAASTGLLLADVVNSIDGRPAV